MQRTDSRRKQWGLPPVEYYWREQGASYDPEAFLKNHDFILVETTGN